MDWMLLDEKSRVLIWLFESLLSPLSKMGRTRRSWLRHSAEMRLPLSSCLHWHWERQHLPSLFGLTLHVEVNVDWAWTSEKKVIIFWLTSLFTNLRCEDEIEKKVDQRGHCSTPTSPYAILAVIAAILIAPHVSTLRFSFSFVFGSSCK